MKNFLFLALSVLTFNAFAGTTYVPSVSTNSFAEARRGCQRASSVTGLPAGVSVGYPLEFNGVHIVVCERYLKDYQNLFPISGYSFVPSVSESSFSEARNGCRRASSVTGLPAGEHIGYPLESNGLYIVVCKRPNY